MHATDCFQVTTERARGVDPTSIPWLLPRKGGDVDIVPS